MARTPAMFRQSDLTRAMKAARAAGLDVARVEIEPTGRIVMTTKDGDDEKPVDDFEAWKAKRDARSTQRD